MQSACIQLGISARIDPLTHFCCYPQLQQLSFSFIMYVVHGKTIAVKDKLVASSRKELSCYVYTVHIYSAG